MPILQAQTPAEIAAVRELLREYATWAFSFVPGSHATPAWEDFDRELKTLPGIYAPPAGALLLALHEQQPAGCVCLKAHGPATAELKRLYVRPAFRGHNLGPQLVRTLIQIARESGYQKIVLDSHLSMQAAHAIYRRAGFRDVSAPADFPDDLKPEVVFMECDLFALPA